MSKKEARKQEKKRAAKRAEKEFKKQKDRQLKIREQRKIQDMQPLDFSLNSLGQDRELMSSINQMKARLRNQS